MVAWRDGECQSKHSPSLHQRRKLGTLRREEPDGPVGKEAGTHLDEWRDVQRRRCKQSTGNRAGEAAGDKSGSAGGTRGAKRVDESHFIFLSFVNAKFE